jgi:hypothetical protein
VGGGPLGDLLGDSLGEVLGAGALLGAALGESLGLGVGMGVGSWFWSRRCSLAWSRFRPILNMHTGVVSRPLEDFMLCFWEVTSYLFLREATPCLE